MDKRGLWLYKGKQLVVSERRFALSPASPLTQRGAENVFVREPKFEGSRDELISFLSAVVNPSPALRLYTRRASCRDYDHRRFDRNAAASGPGRPGGGATCRCANNLRQIGLALGSHVEAFGTFPPGATLCSDPTMSWCSSGAYNCVQCQGLNWNHFLIAYLDNPKLYDEMVSFATTNANEVDDLEWDSTSTTQEQARRTSPSISAPVP